MKYIKKLKYETNNNPDIIYRKINLNNINLTLIYSESLTSGDKISDFIIRSLNNLQNFNPTLQIIQNSISNFKVIVGKTYEELVKYLNNGFSILLLENNDNFLILETKSNNTRSITTPNTEQAIRGSKDSFVENYQTNINLIKKRIKTNNLWIKNINIGKYTDTIISIIYIKGIAKKKLIKNIYNNISKINIDGIINSGTIKNLISKNNILPTIKTTERPDITCNALLEGKIVILVDNDPYVLILPAVLNNFFETIEDNYSNNINTSFTRALRNICFWISLLTPGIYIALINFNQEILPTELLISFAIQRNNVPFPAFFETFTMIISFEILRETDLRVPAFVGSALSIVGALILGEAAVNAGIVSPIVIIITAITAISSLSFTEFDLINSLRWYRLIFMLGATFLGIIGIVIIFIFFIIKLSCLESYNVPYLTPYIPFDKIGIKNSIYKSNVKNDTKRSKFLSNNYIKQRNDKI